MTLCLTNQNAFQITFQLETSKDVAAREALLNTAFGAARFKKTCERLRVGRVPARGLAFTAKHNGKLVGTIRLWRIMAGGVPALLLGPLAVAKSYEGLGLGSQLMRHALDQAQKLGHKAILLVGDASYYKRFGFSADFTENLVLPGPVERERFLGLELVDGALAPAMGLVIATGERAPVARRSRQSTPFERRIARLA